MEPQPRALYHTGPKRIWLIGGTQESSMLADALAQQDMAQTITVTTESARSLYPSIHPQHIWVVVLNHKTLPNFLASQDIGAILDASHPFATGISELAIATAMEHNLPYIRYERPATPSFNDPSNIVRVDRIETLLDNDYLSHQRVFLTLGYRLLHHFKPLHDRATLFARILPSNTALDAARDAGFTSKQLIALRPPLSMPLEKALYQHWNISTVITKASGSAGGEDIKQRVTSELGIKLITIARPTIAYPQQTSNVTDAIAFCKAHVHQPTPHSLTLQEG
ncbi:MAG: cobalt-precorrin-6A reductase [Cyanobacteria bacterium P01_F01_bin.150]